MHCPGERICWISENPKSDSQIHPYEVNGLHSLLWLYMYIRNFARLLYHHFLRLAVGTGYKIHSGRQVHAVDLHHAFGDL